METIKVENVKEAIDEIYRLEKESSGVICSDNIAYYKGRSDGFNECITILENLIVRRQRNEP